jgi:hypothetical protein
MRSGVEKAWGYVRENPLSAAVVLLGAATGAAGAVYFELPGDLTPIWRALGGAVAGAWVGLFPLGFRLYE